MPRASLRPPPPPNPQPPTPPNPAPPLSASPAPFHLYTFLPPLSPPPLQYGDTPLHAAAKTGHAPIVALLLAAPGVNPLVKESLVRGTLRRHRKLCLPAPRHSLLLQDGTPLDVAQKYGNDAAAALLLADPRVAAATAFAPPGASSGGRSRHTGGADEHPAPCTICRLLNFVMLKFCSS